jgi:hypothetical protein
MAAFWGIQELRQLREEAFQQVPYPQELDPLAA